MGPCHQRSCDVASGCCCLVCGWNYTDSQYSVCPDSLKRDIMMIVLGWLSLAAADLLLVGGGVDGSLGIEDSFWKRFEHRGPPIKWTARVFRAFLDIFGQ